MNTIVDDGLLTAREGSPKTDVVTENIVVRALIMQARYVTYREIDAYLGISSTSIH